MKKLEEFINEKLKVSHKRSIDLPKDLNSLYNLFIKLLKENDELNVEQLDLEATNYDFDHSGISSKVLMFKYRLVRDTDCAIAIIDAGNKLIVNSLDIFEMILGENEYSIEQILKTLIVELYV